MANEDDSQARLTAPKKGLSKFQLQLDRVSQNVNCMLFVSLKILCFVSNDPSFWFLQLETVFSNCYIIAEKTKAYYIVAELDLLCSFVLAILSRCVR